MSLPSPSSSSMTSRQIYVLKGLLLGKSNREIARELSLTDYTIKYHCRGIYHRFNVTNRVELFSRFLLQPNRFPPDVIAAVARAGRNSLSPLGNVG